MIDIAIFQEMNNELQVKYDFSHIDFWIWRWYETFWLFIFILFSLIYDICLQLLVLLMLVLSAFTVCEQFYHLTLEKVEFVEDNILGLKRILCDDQMVVDCCFQLHKQVYVVAQVI